MVVKAINRRSGDTELDGSLMVLYSDKGAPIAVFGQDNHTGAIWILKAGDVGFDDYIRANCLAPPGFVSKVINT